MVHAAAINEPSDTAPEARRLDELLRAKARAEIAAAEELVSGKGVVRGQGDPLADVLLVKGSPGPGDLKSGRALAGEDGVAAGKALDALGVPKSRYALCTRVGTAAEADRLARVQLLVEAVDPRTVVLLDAGAAEDFAAAFGVETPPSGVVGFVSGRTVLAVDGLEASLADAALKRRVWQQLQALGAVDSA